MNQLLTDALQSYGFRDKEATLYLTVLELGSWSAATIARLTGIKRVTTYATLEEMVKKWWMRVQMKEHNKTYSATEPKDLIRIKQQEIWQMEEMVTLFESLHRSNTMRPKITQYEWIHEIKRYYDDMLTSKEDIHSFLSLQHLDPLLQQYLDTIFVPQRIKKWLHAKVILSGTQWDQTYINTHTWDHTQTRIIADHEFQFANEITIYWPWKVSYVMFGTDEMVATIVESDKLYSTMMSIFKILRKCSS